MSVLRRQEKVCLQPVSQDIRSVMTLSVMARRAVVKSRSANNVAFDYVLVIVDLMYPYYRHYKQFKFGNER